MSDPSLNILCYRYYNIYIIFYFPFLANKFFQQLPFFILYTMDLRHLIRISYNYTFCCSFSNVLQQFYITIDIIHLHLAKITRYAATPHDLLIYDLDNLNKHYVIRVQQKNLNLYKNTKQLYKKMNIDKPVHARFMLLICFDISIFVHLIEILFYNRFKLCFCSTLSQNNSTLDKLQGMLQPVL